MGKGASMSRLFKSSVSACRMVGAIAGWSAVFCSLSWGAVQDRISGELNGGPSYALTRNVNHQAQPRFDQGPADLATRFQSVMLLTSPTASQEKQLTQLLAQQQDRKSPNYHKWLTPEQWADRFGLSVNDVNKITHWLADQGFTKIQVARGRNWFVFDGTAAQIQRTFGTEIHIYKLNGETHVANATAPKIPASLAGIVTGIRGLDNFYLKPRAILSNKLRPNYYSSTIQSTVLAPGDIATIYDINALYNSSIDGTGQKLAIIGQTDIYLADINDFRTNFGIGSTPISCTTNTNGVIIACNDPHLQYVLANGVEDPGVPTSGDLAEADLDLEWSGAVARGAQVIFVNTPVNTTSGTVQGGGVWESWYYAVDQDLAPVISMSYGACEFFDNNIPNTGTSGDEYELQKANSLGITFVNSSGDTGAAECDPSQYLSPPDLYGSSATGGYAVSYPASSPEVTGVGGTSISIADLQDSTYWNTSNGANDGSATGYVPEQAWNDDAEFVVFCEDGLNPTFCAQGTSSGAGISGWVKITNQQEAQQDFALGPNYNGISAGGGGASNCETQNSSFTACDSGFPQPSWQTVTIPGQASARFSPDVSFLASANFPGYIFCTPLSELGDSGTTSSCAGGVESAVGTYYSIIGGTSVSAPVFAGIVTLLNQSLSASGGLGNVNPTLYQLAGDTSNGAFHQITSGSNTVYCTAGTPGSPQPASLDCPSTGVLGFQASNVDPTNGYNLVTGLGSVDANNLASAWLATVESFTLSANPTAGTLTVAQGGTTNAVNLVVASSSGFVSGSSTAQPLTYTCTGLPGEAACHFSPSSTSSQTTVTLTITTTAPTAKLEMPLGRGSRIFYALAMPGLFGVVVVFGMRKRSVSTLRVLGLIAVLGISTAWMASCGGSSGGGNSDPGTPVGSYTITVNATTGGNPAITASLPSFTLTVSAAAK